MKNCLMLCLMVCLFFSCEKDKHEEPGTVIVIPDSVKGTFVINEGAFGLSNGEISFISNDGSVKISQLFYSANNRPLGDVIQSMQIINNKGFIVANNSQKVEVVAMSNFKSVGVISGFASPRYVLPISNSVAYVSDWSDNNIKIVDLNTLLITGTITTGNGPEQMLKVGSNVYVTNVGGFGVDSTVTIINSLTNTVTTTMVVGVNPNSIIQDANGSIWILCGGSLGADFTPNTADDIGGKLMKIDPTTNTIISTFNFAQGEHPLKITSNKDKTKIYFLNGSSAYTGTVMMMDIAANALPSSPIVNREFYGLGINPSNENICGGIGSFSTNSWMLRYTQTGTLIDSSQVGIGPNGFLFN